MITDATAVAYIHSKQLNCQNCMPKQKDLTSIFTTTAVLLLLLTRACKSELA